MRVTSKTHHLFFNLRSWLVLVRDRSSRKGITLIQTCCLQILFTYASVLGGFHVTSSPPCWWTVNKRSLISSFCLSTSICTFHHCSLCLPRLHENHLLLFFTVSFPSSLSIATLYILFEQTITEYHREL